MKFGESFKKLFSPETETLSPKDYDSSDYEFLFYNFENKILNADKESLDKLEEILRSLDATFGETQMGKDHYRLVNEVNSLKSAGNPSGEVGVDLGEINNLQKEIEEIENLEEFKRYKILKDKMEELINNTETDSQKVA